MYVTQPVTRVFGWCLHCVLRVEGTPKSSSDGALISSCSGAEIAPLCELGRWGGWGAGLFLRCLNVPVAAEFVLLVIDVPPLPSVVASGNFSRISSFSCCMFVFCGNNVAQPDLRAVPQTGSSDRRSRICRGLIQFILFVRGIRHLLCFKCDAIFYSYLKINKYTHIYIYVYMYMYIYFEKFFVLLLKIFKIVRIYRLSCNHRKKLHTKAEFSHSLLQINTNFRAIPK